MQVLDLAASPSASARSGPSPAPGSWPTDCWPTTAARRGSAWSAAAPTSCRGARRSGLVDPARQASCGTCVSLQLLSPVDPDARPGRMFHVEPEAVFSTWNRRRCLSRDDPQIRASGTGSLVRESGGPLALVNSDAYSPSAFGGTAPVLQGRRRRGRPERLDVSRGTGRLVCGRTTPTVGHQHRTGRREAAAVRYG